MSDEQLAAEGERVTQASVPAVAAPASSGASAWVFAAALLARGAVVTWAGARFPAAADGVYYRTLARRLAEGLGYTWAWPDGAVTYAAHYPVGYPALLASAYRLFGESWIAAGTLNALVGALAALAVHRLALEATSPAGALAAGLATALHPGLVAYTPALMTEGITAALLSCAAWCAARRSLRGCVALGVLLGVATLVRPQSVLLAPAWGALAVTHAAGQGVPLAARARRACLATLVALAVCAPWTLRNCVRMNRCALVSVNGGWNLLIGAAPNATGSWSPVEAPESCKTVWDEAGKDACFGREARRMIEADPVRFLALVPARLAATFDYCGAAGFYLHESNGEVFDAGDKVALGAVETAFERMVYLGALLSAARAAGSRPRWRWAVAALGASALLTTHAYVAVLLLLAAMLLRGRALVDDATLVPTTCVALLATVAVHAVFFGAGRYGLVVFPLLTGCAFVHPRSVVRRA